MVQFDKMKLANSYAKNVHATSCDNRKNWKRFYMSATGLEFGLCSFKGCYKKAYDGGHLQIKDMPDMFHYIAPICRSCNQKRQRSMEYSEMKENTTFVRITVNPCTRRNRNRR